ncbi:aspartyl protease [Anaplasma marginale]|uniref:aspartyl protease n=1 Tax=Anaplasma marginale TaxID=770 RepID=UPI0005B3428B|nr:aspartyl protease [Anaplasma marginale]
MTAGRFGKNCELWFDIELIAANGEQFSVEVLFDTGFTAGFLAMNYQDIDPLQWTATKSIVELQTARGKDNFNIYQGKVIIDRTEFVLPVHVGSEISEILMGSQWLEIMELVVNKSKKLLTLTTVEVK